ncbi:MAG: hypothetical protein KC777_28740 [Cyanobacteria bacterium HKST-UBA02]|nr:hypothetical protein [Cyanobacteria bacterium HKST-UBA02]
MDKEMNTIEPNILSISDFVVGLRSHDFHEGLRYIVDSRTKDAFFNNTVIIGKAATLAMHLRDLGALYIPEMELRCAASMLGIGGGELDRVLSELEEVDFITVVRAGTSIKRIELRVPQLRSGYEELGSRWRELNPTDIEYAGIAALNSLFAGPSTEETLAKSLNLRSPDFAIMRDVMTAGQLMSSQTIEGSKYVFSPLAIDGKPDLYLAWANQFPSEVRDVLSNLRESQGLPADDPKVRNNRAVHAAIMTGVFMPVKVDGSTGARGFLFAPHSGVADHEKVILDKARAIVSCVRYGQHYASVNKILSPIAIVKKLISDKQFGKGHPDLLEQYALLASKFIGKAFRDTNGYWNFRVDDTPDNMQALQVALEMLESGDPISAKLDKDVHAALSSSTEYLSPGTTRPRIAGTVEESKETRAAIIEMIAKIGRGSSFSE